MIRKIFAICLVLAFLSGMAIVVLAADTAIQVDMLVPGMELDGDPISGGKVYTYEAGTTTAKTTWLDRNKTSPATNPIILDSEGRAEIFASGLYKFVVKDSSDVTIFTMDGISYGVGDTPQWVYLSQYNSLSEAVTAIGVTPTVLVVDTTDTLTGNVTVPSTITMMPVAREAIDVNSKVLTLNCGIWGGPFQWIKGLGTVTGSPDVNDYNHIWTASTLTDSTTPDYKLQKEYNVYIHATDGDYTSLVGYLANSPTSGDRVFYDVNETLTSGITIPDGIAIKQVKGRSVTINLTGENAITMGNQSILEDQFKVTLSGGTIGNLITMTGTTNRIDDLWIAGTGGTIYNGIALTSSASNNIVSGSCGSGAFDTNVVLDNSSTENNLVTIAESSNDTERSVGANTFTQPYIDDFTNANHVHNSVSTGGEISVVDTNLSETMKVAIVNVGDWNMNSTGSGTALLAVASGLTSSKIRIVHVQIRNDADTAYENLSYFNSSTGTMDGGFLYTASGNLYLYAETGGFFDDADHDSTSYNRGWITIWYVD